MAEEKPKMKLSELTDLYDIEYDSGQKEEIPSKVPLDKKMEDDIEEAEEELRMEVDW